MKQIVQIGLPVGLQSTQIALQFFELLGDGIVKTEGLDRSIRICALMISQCARCSFDPTNFHGVAATHCHSLPVGKPEAPRMLISFRQLTCLTAAVFLSLSAPRAEEVVDLGGGLFGNGGRALLNKPAGKPRAGLVLMTGGDGDIGIGADGSIEYDENWIVRTRAAYLRSGIASLTVDANVDPAKAVAYMRGIAPRVVVVAMSRGALKVASTLPQRPDGVVFASGILNEAQSMIGDPSRLPPTLIIQHRWDACRLTLPDGAVSFQQWTGGKARLVWIEGGTTEGNTCQARAYHGFVGREGQVVSAIASFVTSLR